MVFQMTASSRCPTRNRGVVEPPGVQDAVRASRAACRSKPEGEEPFGSDDAITCRPSVTGVADAWLDFGCRFVLGRLVGPGSHRTLPVRRSRANHFQTCGETSLAGSTSPKRPVRMPAERVALTAFEMKHAIAHTIGLDTATTPAWRFPE